MKQSEEKSEREIELEERVGELKARKEELEGTVLEYEYRLKIKQRPPEKITLKEYLARLYDGSTRGEIIEKGIRRNYIVTDAKLVSFDFTDSLWKRACSLGYALYVYLSDTDGKVTKFKYFCPKKSRSNFEEMLNPLVDTCPQVIVQSTSTRIHFIRGLVKEDGGKVYFDNIH